jgi:hypothetical protein
MMRLTSSGFAPARAVLAGLAVLVISAIAVPAASAAAPANDNFASAVDLGSTANVSMAGTNADSTAEANEPDPDSASFDDLIDNCDPAPDPVPDADCASSVWFKWTAPSTATFQFQTCTSDYDTTLGVYTGSTVDALTVAGPDAENDDTACSNNNLASVVSFAATSGIVYHIDVGGFEAQQGTFTLSTAAAPPFVTPPVATPPAPQVTVLPPSTSQGQKTGKGKKCHHHHKGGSHK